MNDNNKCGTIHTVQTFAATEPAFIVTAIFPLKKVI